MTEIFSKLPLTFLVVLLSVVCIGILILVFIFLHAYLKGREVVFWPPRIGSKPSEKTENGSSAGAPTLAREDSISASILTAFGNEIVTIDQDMKTMRLELSPAIKMADVVGIEKKDIVNHLARKIRAHRVAFSIPRQSVLLPFMDKEFFGIFSWREDLIVCHSIFKMPSDADPEIWSSWNTMLFIYNEAYASRYRMPNSHPTQRDFEKPFKSISEGISMVKTYINKFPSFNSADVQIILKEAASSLERAEATLYEDEPIIKTGDIVSNLEMALSYLHDLMDRCRPPISLITKSKSNPI